jgi:hypothetical protein
MCLFLNQAANSAQYLQLYRAAVLAVVTPTLPNWKKN